MVKTKQNINNNVPWQLSCATCELSMSGQLPLQSALPLATAVPPPVPAQPVTTHPFMIIQSLLHACLNNSHAFYTPHIFTHQPLEPHCVDRGML